MYICSYQLIQPIECDDFIRAHAHTHTHVAEPGERAEGGWGYTADIAHRETAATGRRPGDDQAESQAGVQREGLGRESE